MDILVLGNGFDLAHGLKTSYKDFLRYLEQEFINKNGSKEIKSLCKNNIWFNYFISKYNEVGDKWIDFESEIFKVVKSLDTLCSELEKNRVFLDTLINESKLSNFIKDDLKELKDINRLILRHYDMNYANSFLINYCNSYLKDCYKNICYPYSNELIPDFYGEKANFIIKNLEKDLNDLILSLELYLNKIIEDNIKNFNNENKLIFFKNNKFNRVISFNYTNTYRMIYNQGYGCECAYIHGSIRNAGEINNNKRSNNMVLGITEYLSNEFKDKRLDFVRFKKYFQRICKNTDFSYKDYINTLKNYNNSKLNNNLNYKIYIYGHSLDVMDKDVLYDILSVECDIVIFFYDDKDYDNKIINLIKIIGQDELRKRFHSKKNRIIFTPWYSK